MGTQGRDALRARYLRGRFSLAGGNGTVSFSCTYLWSPSGGFDAVAPYICRGGTHRQHTSFPRKEFHQQQWYMAVSMPKLQYA
jgi:hypothetical protein